VNIYLLQNFESIDTQPSLGGRYAYPIPYFDNGPATDGLHIGGSCHEQGRSHDPSGLCQVQYRRGGCHLRIWTASAGRQLPVQLRHRRDSNTRLNLSLHSEVKFRWCPSITTSNTYSPRKVSHITFCEQLPQILHSQTPFHNNIYKEQGKDSFYSEFVLQSIIKMFGPF